MGAAAPKPPLAIPPHSKLRGFLAFSRERLKPTPRSHQQRSRCRLSVCPSRADSLSYCESTMSQTTGCPRNIHKSPGVNPCPGTMESSTSHLLSFSIMVLPGLEKPLYSSEVSNHALFIRSRNHGSSGNASKPKRSLRGALFMNRVAGWSGD